VRSGCEPMPGKALPPLVSLMLMALSALRPQRSFVGNAALCPRLFATCRLPHSAGPRLTCGMRRASAAARDDGSGPAFYVVRHGQSSWNLAAKRLDLWTMFSQVDHPLTSAGVAQARSLHETVKSAAAEGDVDATIFLSSTTPAFSSPLTRAVCTSALALGWERTITLLPDAREISWPICGPDSIGGAVGDHIVHRAHAALRDAMDDDTALPTHEAMLAAFDASTAQGRWWSGFREPRAAMRARLGRLLRSGHGSQVLVSHCMLIRQLFIDFASPNFEVRQPDWLTQVRTRSLANCGVLRLQLDASGLIDDARLLFGTKLL